MSETAKPVVVERRQPKPSGETVWVGCKHPAGIFIYLEGHRLETPPQGGNQVKVHFPVGDRVLLRGSNTSNVHGGYGLTEVNKDWFDKWMEANKQNPLVENRLVFVSHSEATAREQAVEQKDVKSGLEPMQQKDIKIETADA